MNNGTNNEDAIQVLVGDDSAFMRTALRRMIESDPSLRVIATAPDGLEVLRKAAALHPDVITLDIEMPRLNGIETLKRLMRETPCPVIIVSSLTQEGANATLEALALGAFDYLPKQLSYASLDIEKIQSDLVAKIRAAADATCRKRMSRSAAQDRILPRVRSAYNAIPSIVAIGTSTGGPRALQEILPMLPKALPVGILVVQHMPKGFTRPFAHRLDGLCEVSVREASQGDRIEPGVVLIAPAGQQLTVSKRNAIEGVIHLSSEPANTPHIPSVDVMMHSVAESYGALAMGIIMTGMGTDGTAGMAAIAAKSGITVGQNEATCTVYGMPKSCAEAGLLQQVVPLRDIPSQILQAVHYRKHA
jgi:two-component system chemotaxis response regulator CheB